MGLLGNRRGPACQFLALLAGGPLEGCVPVAPSAEAAGDETNGIGDVLSIQLNDKWVALEPVAVARMMLDGELDQSTPARDLTQTDAEGPLARFLSHPHFEELGGQLLRHLHSMYLAGSAGIRPDTLRARVANLCKWDLSDRIIRGRLWWVAGWLEELTGSFERAIQFYDLVLQQPSAETSLRLLACSNRGVLRIRLGRVEGVRDLARAAILLDPDQSASPWATVLPAAAFNLLNLLNVAVQSEALCDGVELVLVDFMARLPKVVRQEWIGPDPRQEDNEKGGKRHDHEPLRGAFRGQIAGYGQSGGGGISGTPVEAGKAVEAADPEPSEESEQGEAELLDGPPILRDPTFRRLNRLAWKLALVARDIAPGPEPRAGGFHECAVRQLQLWTQRPEVDVAGDEYRLDGRARSAAAQHASYAEAASLLYACHIPSSLTPREYTAVWSERLAQENVARAQEYLGAGDYGLARSALELALEALDGSKAGRARLGMRRQIEQQLRVVVERERVHRQLELHQACTSLRQDVERFCTRTNLCHARRESEDLQRRLDRLKVGLEGVWGEALSRVMDDLGQRVARHLRQLEQREAEARVREPLERLRQEWPDDWAVPVPDAVYRALAECRANDPRRIEEWDLLKSQLDAHQAQCHFQRALRATCAAGVDRKQVEEHLALALSFDPSLGGAAAPVFGLLNLQSAGLQPGDTDRIRHELLEVATRLAREQPLGADAACSSAIRADLIREACSLLQRLFRAFLGVGGDMVKLWDDFAKGFAPTLAEGRPEMVREIEQMLEACLDACPRVAAGLGARSDPRNPLILLLERCEKARALGEGEQALSAKPPRQEEAAERFGRALELGLEDGDRLQRAVRGLYLARIGVDDLPECQRRVLDALDAWADEVSRAGQGGDIRPDDVAKQVEGIRRQEKPKTGPNGSSENPPGPSGPPDDEPGAGGADDEETQEEPEKNGQDVGEQEAR